MNEGTFITARNLIREDACLNQVHQFERMWPNGAEVNLRNLKRAYKAKLDLYWFGVTFYPYINRRLERKHLSYTSYCEHLISEICHLMNPVVL